MMQAKKRARKGPADSSLDALHARLSEVLSTFAALREDGRSLLERIHSSLLEMRQLRQQIREQRSGKAPAEHSGFSPARAVFLQDHFGLTGREIEVAFLLAQGRSNVAIAKALGISTHTARHHTQRVLGKMKVHSRAEAGAKLRG
jgi:DNA-binding CsgD family transcriptional regulator